MDWHRHSWVSRVLIFWQQHLKKALYRAESHSCYFENIVNSGLTIMSIEKALLHLGPPSGSQASFSDHQETQATSLNTQLKPYRLVQWHQLIVWMSEFFGGWTIPLNNYSSQTSKCKSLCVMKQMLSFRNVSVPHETQWTALKLSSLKLLPWFEFLCILLLFLSQCKALSKVKVRHIWSVLLL